MNGIESLHHTCMVFPLSNDFIIENGHFRLKHKSNGWESLKSIENRCTHWAMRLFLVGKHAHGKGNIRHVRTWSQAISSNFSCLFRSKIAKIAKEKCSHCAMVLDYCFRWLSTAPSHRIITLWVHPFRLSLVTSENSTGLRPVCSFTWNHRLTQPALPVIYLESCHYIMCCQYMVSSGIILHFSYSV